MKEEPRRRRQRKTNAQQGRIGNRESAKEVDAVSTSVISRQGSPQNERRGGPGRLHQDIDELPPVVNRLSAEESEASKVTATDANVNPSYENYTKLAEIHMAARNGNVRLLVREGLLYRQYKAFDGGEEGVFDQLVLPVQCRRTVLEFVGHLEKKILDRIQQRFYRPSVFNDVSDNCKSCDMCQKSAGKKSATTLPDT